MPWIIPGSAERNNRHGRSEPWYTRLAGRVTSMEPMERWSEDLQRDGFAIVPGVFTEVHAESIATVLDQVLKSLGDDESAIRSPEGITYAARNLLSIWP